METKPLKNTHYSEKNNNGIQIVYSDELFLPFSIHTHKQTHNLKLKANTKIKTRTPQLTATNKKKLTGKKTSRKSK